MADIINFAEFQKIEIRVGLVKRAEDVEGSKKLIRLGVSFGEWGERVIFTGVRGYGYGAEDFVDKQFLFVVNLEPKKIMKEESQGMILAVDGLELEFGEHGEAKPLFIAADKLPLGAKVR